MKIQVSLSGLGLCVCAAASAQAQTLTASGPYVAVTDRNPYPKPPLPALGPAGTTITDPVFRSAITRVTDAATRPGHLNYSYRTTSSPHQNEWSAHGSYFYVVSDDGTAIPFRFDASTGTASRINPSSTGNGGMTLLTYVEPQFSYVNDSIIYIGYSGSGTNNRTIDQYDFSTGLYTTLVNLDMVVPGLSGTYIGGIASSAGLTERVETFFGGTSQDHHHYVLLFDSANPSNRVLLDTWASTVNGQPTPITLNFSLHHVAIDRSGRYVMLYTTYADQTGTRQAPQSYVWDTQTGSFFAMVAAVRPYGHDALGYGVSVNQDCCTSTTWDAAQWQFRSLATPATTRDMLPTVLSPKEVYLADHTSWNNASPTALVPYVTGTYRYGNNTTPWRALDDEIAAVETDVPGQNPTIWRFAQHRSDVSYDGNPTAVSFWYEPRPNVSDDGRWVLFTSNWEKTLGIDPKGDAGTTARQDVFVVKLGATPRVSISTAALPTGRDALSYSTALQATGGSGAFVWTVASGALPAGLVLDSSSGVLAGVPTVFGTFGVTIAATDANDSTNSAAAAYTIALGPPPVQITTAALPSGRETFAYAAGLQGSGGSGASVWSIASGALPSGLTLDPSSGSIAGTPRTAGQYTTTFALTDSADPTNTAAATFTITVASGDWRDADVGLTGATGSGSYWNGGFKVLGAGADVWGTADAFNYMYVPVSGDGTIIARVATISNQASWVKAGVMIRGSLSASSAQAFMLVSYAKGVAFQRRTADGATSVNSSGTASAAPHWVKIVRSGSTITGYESTDGASWTFVGSDTFVMGANAYIGLAVSSHVFGTLASAAFDSVSVSFAAPASALPTWTDSDVGSVAVPGSANEANGIFTVTGSGADVWGTADAFHYDYTTLNGDGTMVARVASVQNVSSWVKAGVMIRESLDPGAAHAFVLVSAAKGVAFQRREATGGLSVGTAGSAAAAPHWVKLTRSGNTFTAYESADGITWTQIDSDTIPMAAQVYIGLAVTSHSTSSSATCTFDNVSIQ